MAVLSCIQKCVYDSRRFNAVIPFLITMVITLVGMILDGWQKIKNMPDDENKLVETDPHR